MRSKPRPATSSSSRRPASSSPAPTAPSASWSWRTRSAPALKLPPDGPQSLDVKHVSEGAPAAYPNGCHVCEVEIDPDTGNIEVVKYTAVNDFGTIINPMLVDGQTHGGVVQGIGQALLEHTVYDEQGQLLTGSFMDYAMPRAHHAPDFAVLSHPVPAKTNPLGVKGCGEAGCAGSLTSIMNAVVDALSVYGIKHIDMPATPQRVWQAIQDAQPKAAAKPMTPMTQATDLAFAARRRRRHARLIAGVSAAHFVSHFYMLVLPPLFAFVRAEYGVSYTELGLALTVFNAVSAVLQTPAGFLVDRINARLAAGRRASCSARSAFAVAGARELLLGAGRDVRLMGLGNTVYHPADYALLSRHVVAERDEPGLFGAHLRRHARQRGGAGMRAVHAQPVRLARRVYRRGRARLRSPPLFLVMQRDAPATRQPAAQAAHQTAQPADTLALAAVGADPDQLRVLHAAVAHQLRPALLLGRGARRALRHARRSSPTPRCPPILLVQRGRRADRRLDRGPHATARPGRRSSGLVATALACLLIGIVDLGAVLLIPVMSLGGFCTGVIMPSRDMIVREVTPPGSFGKVFGFVTTGFNIGGIDLAADLRRADGPRRAARRVPARGGDHAADDLHRRYPAARGITGTLDCCVWRVSFSENRYPPRIKSGGGIFRDTR